LFLAQINLVQRPTIIRSLDFSNVHKNIGLKCPMQMAQ